MINNEIYDLPTSAANNIIMEVLSIGKDIADLSPRKKQVDHGNKYTIMQCGNMRRVIVQGNKTDVAVEILDINQLVGCNKGAKKIFTMALIQIDTQALYNGILVRDFVSFPLQDIVDMGIYSSLGSARQGFKDAMDLLTGFKVEGNISKGKKESVINQPETLFVDYEIKRGWCKIFLNTNIDWNFFRQYYTILPGYYFQLPNNAGDLLYYIFYLGRQNLREITENGCFKIGFRAIHCKLMLPDEKMTKNPQRDIKDVILNTVKQLEEVHNKIYGEGEFVLTPFYDKQTTITNFLKYGYLEVAIKGSLAKELLNSKSSAKAKNKEYDDFKQCLFNEAYVFDM